MKHKFMRDSRGDIDYEVGDYHYGPICLRCHAGWCYGCDGDEFEQEPCPGSSRELPGQFDMITGDVIQ